MNYRSKGFSIVEVIIVVAVIAIVGFVGWRAWGTFSNTGTADTTQINTDQAPVVTNNASLDKSSVALDAIDIGGAESTQLQSQTNF